MVTSYELKLDNFQGPLGKLLELIEGRKMEINEISLSAVTDDFLVYLKSLEDLAVQESVEYLRLLVDFIEVASRLIFLKSKNILPSALAPEEEAEIKDLEKRLKIYRGFKPAAKIISRLWQKDEGEFGRPYFLSLGYAGNWQLFYPGENLEPESLFRSASRILDSWQKMALENQTLKEEVISVEKKMQEILRKLEKFGKFNFHSLTETKKRPEVVAMFLAILHLAGERSVFLEQKERFSDIMVKRQQ